MSTCSSRRSFLGGAIAFAGVAPGTASAGKRARPEAPASLRRRRLGKTGLEVTTVGLGCMITSDVSVIERAADLGINHFDTARYYMGGNNERLVGAALKGRRDRVLIATKVLHRDPAEATRDLDTSLRELGTDHLDIWYLHDIRDPQQMAPALVDVQRKAVRDGKVRFIGVSVHMNHDAVIPAALATGAFDVLLTTYNFALGSRLDALLQKARAAGLGIVGMKAMAGSFRLPGATDDTFQARVKQPGAALAALKWCLRTRLVDCVIPSIKDMTELEEDVRAMSEPYGAADERLLTTQLASTSPRYCRGCGSCAGACRQGLAVADLVRFAMYSEGYGEYRLGREMFQALPAHERERRCADCLECTVRCPNGVQVAERVRRAQSLFASV
jgi:aryl-alcohol dehydrogenase-like predicted oxidoreductase